MCVKLLAGAVTGFAADSYVNAGATDNNRTGSNRLPNFRSTVSHPIPEEQWDSFRFLESSYEMQFQR
jgi:hypothetical protein